MRPQLIYMKKDNNAGILYKVAEKIFKHRIEENTSNDPWLLAIFSALIAANERVSHEIIWTENEEWNITALINLAKSAAEENKIQIRALKILSQTKDTVIIGVKTTDNSCALETSKLVFSKKGFSSKLWETKNPFDESILADQLEMESLFEATLKYLEKFNYIQKVSRRVNINDIKNLKITALQMVIDAITQPENQVDQSQQQAFLELVVGSAIHYMPTLNNQFNGFVSFSALKSFLTKGGIIKKGAKLKVRSNRSNNDQNITLEALQKKCYTSLIGYNYILSTEIDYALKNRNTINLFPNSEEEKFRSHNELKNFIAYLGNKNIEGKSIEEVMILLKEFRTDY
jgi:hypothetical protein